MDAAVVMSPVGLGTAVLKPFNCRHLVFLETEVTIFGKQDGKHCELAANANDS